MIAALPDAAVLFAAAASTASVISGLAMTAARHRRRLAALPIRIHVAGTRGKTTVTRLIWGGLRGGGIRTAAKTTGTLPVLLAPDGTERPWPRWGPASIAEQWRFVRAAHALDAQAIVLECMAIQPEFVWASQRFAARATIAVITNVRPDHTEAIAPAEVAQAMALAVPHHGNLVLGSEAAQASILAAARAQGTHVEIVDGEETSAAEANRRLALAVCRTLGVPDADAERGMAGAGADLGALRAGEIEIDGCRLRVISAFACNDPVSLERLWQQHHDPAIDRLLVIMNARTDRPQRTVAMLATLHSLGLPMRLLLPARSLAQLGLARHGFARLIRAAGFSDAQIGTIPSNPAAALVELARIGGARAEVWGVGNFQGFGEAMARHLASRLPAC